jgi:hypothetical protein
MGVRWRGVTVQSLYGRTRTRFNDGLVLELNETYMRIDTETRNEDLRILTELILEYPVPPDPNATAETIAASNALYRYKQILTGTRASGHAPDQGFTVKGRWYPHKPNLGPYVVR